MLRSVRGPRRLQEHQNQRLPPSTPLGRAAAGKRACAPWHLCPLTRGRTHALSPLLTRVPPPARSMAPEGVLHECLPPSAPLGRATAGKRACAPRRLFPQNRQAKRPRSGMGAAPLWPSGCLSGCVSAGLLGGDNSWPPHAPTEGRWLAGALPQAACALGLAPRERSCSCQIGRAHRRQRGGTCFATGSS